MVITFYENFDFQHVIGGKYTILCFKSWPHESKKCVVDLILFCPLLLNVQYFVIFQKSIWKNAC
jgi:hypothetical protein